MNEPKAVCFCGNNKPLNQLWCDKCHESVNLQINVPPHHNPQQVIAEHMAFQNKSSAEQAGILQREREGKGFKL